MQKEVSFQDCQIFLLAPNIPKWENTYLHMYLPNYHKIYQMEVNNTKWIYIKVAIKYTKFTIPSCKITKINPNWDFWSENIPSGNPALF
jgi:hypothetical protein